MCLYIKQNYIKHKSVFPRTYYKVLVKLSDAQLKLGKGPHPYVTPYMCEPTYLERTYSANDRQNFKLFSGLNDEIIILGDCFHLYRRKADAVAHADRGNCRGRPDGATYVVVKAIIPPYTPYVIGKTDKGVESVATKVVTYKELEKK